MWKPGILGIGIKFSSILMGLVVAALLAQILGPKEYGLYSVAFAAMTILAVPSRLGLPNFVVREVAGAVAGDTPALLRRIVAAALMLVAVSSAVVLGLAFAWTGLVHDMSSYGETLLIGLCLVPILAVTVVLGAALRGMGRLVAGLLPEQVVRYVLLIGLLLVCTLFVDDVTAPDAMGLHVVAALLALGVTVVIWIGARPPRNRGRAPSVSMRTMLLSTGSLGVIAGAQTLNANLDILMLGYLTDAETAGLYKVASTAALLPVAGMQAINMVAMPDFARAYRDGNRQRLQDIATRCARLIVATALPASLALILGGVWMLRVMFGADYVASYLPMVILVAGQLVSALFGSVITILNMTGHERDVLKGVVIASLLNIALNAALIPPFGAVGAAAATSGTVIFWNIVLHVAVQRRLSINSALLGNRQGPQQIGVN